MMNIERNAISRIRQYLREHMKFRVEVLVNSKNCRKGMMITDTRYNQLIRV